MCREDSQNEGSHPEQGVGLMEGGTLSEDARESAGEEEAGIDENLDDESLARRLFIQEQLALQHRILAIAGKTMGSQVQAVAAILSSVLQILSMCITGMAVFNEDCQYSYPVVVGCVP